MRLELRDVYFWQLPFSGTITALSHLMRLMRSLVVSEGGQNNVLYQSGEIVTGIRKGDMGQLNILVSLICASRFL